MNIRVYGEIIIPEFSSKISVSDIYKVFGIQLEINPNTLVSKLPLEYRKSLLETRSINDHYGKGIPKVTNCTKAELSNRDKIYIQNNIKDDYRKYISIKSDGRLEDAHTSRFSVVYSEKYLIKFITNNDTDKDGIKKRQLNNEAKIASLLNNEYSNSYIKIDKKNFKIRFPKVIASRDGQHVIYEYINGKNIKNPIEVITYYRSFNNLEITNEIRNNLQSFNFQKWVSDFESTVETLCQMGLIEINLKDLILSIHNLEKYFTENILLIHGDPKIDQHVLINNSNVFFLDLERVFLGPQYYDLAKLNIKILREGYGYIYPYYLNKYEIKTVEDLKALYLLESYLILSELLTVFKHLNIKTTSINALGIKKYRDFKILCDKVFLNLNYIGVAHSDIDVANMFNKFELKYA